MKKFILSIFVFIIGFIGISSAQFVSSQDIICSQLNEVFDVSSCNSFSVSSSGRFSDVSFGVRFTNGQSNFKGYYDSIVDFNDSSFPGKKISNFYIYICSKGSYGGSDVLTFTCDSPKMSVSALSPAINGLYSVVLECLPLIVYVCIGVLVSILGFYAIKWLIDYILGKIKDLF